MGANGMDIETRIMKEAHDFQIKRYKQPDYVILDNDTYEELLASCRELNRSIKPLPDITKYAGMDVVRTFTAGRGIAVGEDAR
ncbi:hypothetical protein [Bacillus phage CP-51]|uniref:Uncharacterized protein n=1 Tax=Bacillus phage CP-51 TaxID=1391188 RepID=A0A068EMQ5_9CAUD|nr:hypothetical protein OZ73_gp060 [Bacillus phage CP-51]AID50495.1 hypothetical protein [Bacillus phage CP-51]